MTDIPFPLSAFRKITDICISMLCDSCSANRESIKYTLPFENHVVTQCPRSRSYNIWIAVKKSEHINRYLVIPSLISICIYLHLFHQLEKILGLYQPVPGELIEPMKFIILLMHYLMGSMMCLSFKHCFASKVNLSFCMRSNDLSQGTCIRRCHQYT